MSSAKDAAQKFNGAVKPLTGDALDFIKPSYSEFASYQIVPADLTLEAGAGSGVAGNPKYLAAIMGNILGDLLTKDQNYLGGVIGAYSITGAKSTTYPAGAVLAQITDGVTEADGAVVAYIDGDGSVTKATAAFKGMSNNSTPGSGFDYGLDMHGPAHDGYLDLAILKADVRMSHEVVLMNGAGVPTDGVAGTGAGFAEIGSEYHDRTNGNEYINNGTKASPAWKLVQKAGLFTVLTDLGPAGAATRTLNTIYQNTTGKPILLLLECQCQIEIDAGGSAYAYGDLNVNNFTPPTSLSAQVALDATNLIATQTLIANNHIVYVIPNGYYYRMVDSLLGNNSAVVIDNWYETPLF